MCYDIHCRRSSNCEVKMNEDEKLVLSLKLKDILLSAINDYVKENPQCNMDSLTARETLSIFIISYLSPYIDQYEDEINSLWFMLEEIKASNDVIRGPEFTAEINKMVDLQLANLKLMQNLKGEA